jgi:hypothetical protein
MNRPRFGIPLLTDKKRLIEDGKTALIVILVISALMLSVRIWLLPDVSDSEVINGVLSLQVGAADSSSGTYKAAAAPFCVVVTPAAGAHCTLIYDDTAVASAYERFSANLGEALGSAGEPEAISEEEWEAALSGCGVYFDFLSDQPLDALAGWLGITASGSTALHTARQICLSADASGGVSLYYVRTREGTACRCTTKLSGTDLCGKLEGYVPDGSKFNFEQESPFSLVDKCALITQGQLSIRSVTAEDPISGETESDTILASFGMNSILADHYPEADGAEVFVEGENTLRIETSGTVIFSRTGHAEQTGTLTTAQAIETARVACEKALGQYCGSAVLYLSYIWHDSATDVYVIRFDYALNGLPVSFTSGASAAEFTLTGDEITSAMMIFRSYSNTDKTEAPLPALQAAAVIQASGGGEPVLAYTDDMASVGVNWTIR